jgi:hypothetical protein
MAMMECLFQRATKASNNLFVTMAFGHVNGGCSLLIGTWADSAYHRSQPLKFHIFLASVCRTDGADGVFRDGASSASLV